MRVQTHRRGFTLIELTATIAALATIGASGILSLGARQPEGSDPRGLEAARLAARIKKDELQIRGIHQAMVVWAQNHNDKYPLPSGIDKANATVKEEGRAKDTTANIYSTMIYTGSLTADMFISPLEKNPNVVADSDYKNANPTTAVDPSKALWDPAFSVALGPTKGNASYAHLQPAGKRLKRWSNTFNAGELVLSSRGPQISSVKLDSEGRAVPTFAKPDSVTLSMFGESKTWTGHVVFNDNHVDLFKTTIAHEKPYTGKAIYTDDDGTKHPDLILWDEPADKLSVNVALGLFTKAGDKATDFKSIGD